MANGQAIGSLIGAGAGAAIGGPAGIQAGAGIGSAAGGLFESITSGNKAQESAPLREDPNQVARLREIENTKKQISQGTDPLTRARIGEVQQLGETTKGQVGRFTGGAGGATVNALLKAQRNIGQGVNQAFTQSQSRLPFFENLQTQLGNRISQRKLELDIRDQNQALGEQKQSQTGMQNTISGLLGQTEGFGGQGIGSGGQPSLASPGLLGMGGGGADSLGQVSPSLAESFRFGLAG